MLIDVHCHLDHRDFHKDLAAVVERARAAGVKVIITNGINPETNRISLELAKRFDIVRPAMGIYPIDALQNEVKSMDYPMELKPFDVDEELAFIEQHQQDIVAIGEVGLDFQSGDQKEMQKDVFQKLIELARKLNKPLIVHSRKAETDCVDILQSSSLKKVVLHYFNGNFKLVKRAADNNWYFSIPTNIVRSEHFQKIVKEVDLSRLLTETDAPFLSPFRGERNEPAFVAEVAKKIAEIKGMEEKEVKNNIFLNYERLFL